MPLFLALLLVLHLAFPSLHVTTCENFGVVELVCGGEGLFYKVGNPITELVITRCDEAALFSVQGVADAEFCLTAVATGKQVKWIDAIA